MILLNFRAEDHGANLFDIWFSIIAQHALPFMKPPWLRRMSINGLILKDSLIVEWNTDSLSRLTQLEL